MTSPLRGFGFLLVVVAGCGDAATKPKQAREMPKNYSELETRYAQLEIGMTEDDVAEILGRREGYAVAGYSTNVISTKGSGERGSEKYWASGDSTGAIGIVFRTDDRGRKVIGLVSLVKMTAMGPAPMPKDDPSELKK